MESIGNFMDEHLKQVTYLSFCDHDPTTNLFAFQNNWIQCIHYTGYRCLKYVWWMFLSKETENGCEAYQGGGTGKKAYSCRAGFL